MIKKVSLSVISLLLISLQSCFFGAGLVEQSLSEDYFLFANNSLEEMSIWLHVEDQYNRQVVPETVFAVGYNDDFIIAKQHPKMYGKINRDSTNYYLIEVEKKQVQESTALNYAQFLSERKRLNVPDDLDFHIIIKEVK